ncbi:MAG TPA: DNA-binding domain-containing protein [Methylibium sp.]|nr:DNA-binding domain-containing protein [Methylibium sp.]
MSHAVEARRQSALLAALLVRDAPAPAGLREQGERAARGLAAYRANAATIAERALRAAYPSVAAMLGDADFAALARTLWRAAPPTRGDLAQWGLDLPAWIESRRDLDPWPWLADAARLDAAVARCESAADAATERDSLALLADHEPAALRLRLLPCVQLLASDWPVATLRAAHRDGAGDDALAAARDAIAAGHAEAVVVARDGWRARVTALDAPTFAWMQALHADLPLDAALAQAGPAFAFDAWLIQSLQQGWLWRAERRPAATTAPTEENPP